MSGYIHRWTRGRLIATVIVLILPVVGIALSELAILYGQIQLALWGHVATLLLAALTPNWFKRDINVSAVLTLIPLFRLVSLSMPVFVPETLYWLALVYGSLLMACYLIAKVVRTVPDDANERDSNRKNFLDLRSGGSPAPGRQETVRSLSERASSKLPLSRLFKSSSPNTESDGGKVVAETDQDQKESGLAAIGLRFTGDTMQWRLTAVLLFPGIAVSVMLAEVEYIVIDPEPIIQTLAFVEVLILSIVMIGLVGFVEELLFRGLLQKTLQYRLGRWQGILLASFLFALTYSVYGHPSGMLMGGAIALTFGLVYDRTNSLALVSIMHGVLNIFLLAVIPIQGPVLLAFV